MRVVFAVCTILLLFPTPATYGQVGEEEHIETDRDSFTPATTTAGRNRLILESAYSFIDNENVPETHSFPELLARYGVTDWLELRLGTNYEVGGASSSVSGGVGGQGDFEADSIESESTVFYGFKTALTEQDGWMPEMATILQGYTPTSGPETRTHLVATYVFGWIFFEDWTWDSAIRFGTGSEEEDNFNRWAPSTVVKVALTEKWNGHLEYFGIFTDGREEELSQSYISPGLHYLVTPDFEVGVRVGWGLGGDAANFFSNAGVGLRF
jgi:hypothetical protein